MFEWLKTLQLPKGSDLAIWWIGLTCFVAIVTHMEGAKDVVLALGGGMVGFLTGHFVAKSGADDAK